MPTQGAAVATTVDVSMSKTGFTAAGQAITVTADAVGNTGTDFIMPTALGLALRPLGLRPGTSRRMSPVGPTLVQQFENRRRR